MKAINKKSLLEFFRDWTKKSIKELDGKKLTFPDDWPEDFDEQCTDYFCEYFGVKDE